MNGRNSATADTIFEAVVTNGLSGFLETYNSGTAIFLSIANFIVLAALIINITKIASSGSDSKARAEAIQNTLVSGICFSCLCIVDVLYLLLISFVLGV